MHRNISSSEVNLFCVLGSRFKNQQDCWIINTKIITTFKIIIINLRFSDVVLLKYAVPLYALVIILIYSDLFKLHMTRYGSHISLSLVKTQQIKQTLCVYFRTCVVCVRGCVYTSYNIYTH